MFPIDRTCIDKSLPVPVGTQLRGLLAYMIGHGDLPYGTRLPSVRVLAQELGLAPMTVNQVFKQLRESGLVEIRRGLGAYVARDPASSRAGAREDRGLHSKIDALIEEALGRGMPSGQLVSMVGARYQMRRARTGLRLLFVGIFEGPTADYAADIRPFLAPEDSIACTTIEALRAGAPARADAAAFDLVLTFVHREAEVRAVVPRARIAAIRFTPSEATRARLAGIARGCRVAAVTRFQDYIAIMRPSIRQFAPQISDIRVTYSDAPGLAKIVAAHDVVVFATGADAVRDLVRDGRPCFEYRHAPDTDEIARILVPLLADLRLAKAKSTPAARAAPTVTSSGTRRRQPAAAAGSRRPKIALEG